MAVLLLGYRWLLGFPAPAMRAGALLVLADVARLRERVVARRGVVALAALGVLVQDAWALESVGGWLSITGVGAVVWAGRAFARAPRLARLAAPALVATLLTAPISAFAFGTVAPIGVLANLIAIPLAGVAVPGLVMALGLSWLGFGLAHLIAAGAGLGLALLDLVARGAALVPGGHIVMVAGWQAALTWTAVAAVAGWQWSWRPTATRIIWAGCRRSSRHSTRSWCSSRGSRWGGRYISSFSPGSRQRARGGTRRARGTGSRSTAWCSRC